MTRCVSRRVPRDEGNVSLSDLYTGLDREHVLHQETSPVLHHPVGVVSGNADSYVSKENHVC